MIKLLYFYDKIMINKIFVADKTVIKILIPILQMEGNSGR